MCDADQRVAGYSRQTEESDGRPAGEIRKDQKCHPLGHSGVRMRGQRVAAARVAAADRVVHVRVTQADAQEGQCVDHQQHQQVGRVSHVAVLQWQANAKFQSNNRLVKIPHFLII